MADDTPTVEQARAQALTYALALMRDRVKVEAPTNAAIVQRHINVLLAWVATAPTPAMADDMTPEQLAKLFHGTYERLAPSFGYKTRPASAKAWANVPERNKSLMIAVAAEVLAALDKAKAS